MRRSLVALLVFAIAIASEWRAAAHPFDAETRVADADALSASGRRLIMTGQALITVGCIGASVNTIFAPLGLWLMNMNYQPPPANQPPPRTYDRNAIPGAVIGIAISTVVLLGVGIPLLAEGDARIERAHKLVGTATVRVAAASGGLEVAW